jgi:phosphoenolpyruvate-protein kinase (PTS system EI component)
MLGTRGVRLGVIKPGLYAMQVAALMEAATDRVMDGGHPIIEVMIPLTVSGPELALARSWVEEAVAAEFAAPGRAHGRAVEVSIGTMIETPRAALRAGDLAEFAEFFSFGTNDLTQMTFGFSRDDVEGRMMSAYLDEGLLARNPFEVVDADGVGELVRMAVERGRAVRPDLKIGVCGEHGGDPASIATFYEAGLDYVSCSPFRVPVARLAAAQAVLDAAPVAKRSAAKKVRPARKAPVKKAKKAAAKRSAAKKAPGKKAPAKKAGAKRVARKAPARRAPAKKGAAKKAVKKAPARRAPARRTAPAKRPAKRVPKKVTRTTAVAKRERRR